MTVRGENYVSVIDAATFAEKTRIVVPNGPGMQIFSPDGKYGYVCSSFNPETDIVSVANHKIIARIKQDSPFCPNIAATPDGDQVWFTLKDIGRVEVFNAHPPFNIIKSFDTGPITNHVNIVRNAKGSFAYVTVGGLNEVLVFRTSDFANVAKIAVGKLPHGLWPSGDGTRLYVGLENADAFDVIDTLTNKVIATIPTGQAPQAVAYVPDAVPSGDGLQNLQPLGIAGQATHLDLVSAERGADGAPVTSVSLFDQGLLQVLQASVSGLAPKQPYVLALSDQVDGAGDLEKLAAFVTNPAGSAIVNAIGRFRQVDHLDATDQRRYLVIVPGGADRNVKAVQVQMQP